MTEDKPHETNYGEKIYNNLLEKLKETNKITAEKMQQENRLGGSRFPALRIISGILTALAVVLFFSAVISLVIGVGTASGDSGKIVLIVLSALAASVLLGLWGLFILASAEGIKVILAIEENTRMTAMKSGGSTTLATTVTPNESHCGNCGKTYPEELKGQYCEICGGVIV